jgi:hypothetical protein
MTIGTGPQTSDQAAADQLGPEDQRSLDDARSERLNALGLALAKKRGDAIQGRQQCGIESVWIGDEEHYQGVDDANRAEHINAWHTKPPGMVTPPPAGTTRSTVFPNVTRPYCDAAAARIADMLLPNDDRNWSLEPTPVPELAEIAAGQIPDWMQQEMQAEPGVDAARMQQMQAAVIDQAKKIVDEAKKMADKAQERISDWQIEGQWHAEVRRVIEDAARCGSGVLKGPVPVKRKVVILEDVAGDGQAAPHPNVFQRIVTGIRTMLTNAKIQTQKQLIVKEEIKPASKWVSFWNFFPDPACGDNLHNGSFTFEKDYLAPKQLKDLKGTPGYIDNQIEACLEEGPMRAVAPSKDNPNDYANKSGEGDTRFEIWYYHGSLDKEELAAAGCDCPEGEDVPLIPAQVTMVNNRVIRASLNPLDSGDYPYDIMPWQRQPGSPWGIGVARQGRTPQRIVTAATRNLMDNGGLSAGPQIILKNGLIVPADGNYTITPRKVWYAGEDSDIEDVSKAITFVDVPSMQAELMEIIQFGLKMMEDSTGLPMLLQGQQGKAPDTVGGMTLLNNNASAVLRRLARTFDDCVTEPHIRRYYTWLLQYGEDDEKGDCQIDARGSSALVERDLQATEIAQMAAVVTNPIFGLDPKKWARELLKSRKFDSRLFEYDDPQWQKIVEQMGQKPQDPREAIAQLKAQTDEKLLQLTQTFEATENEKERENKVVIEMINEKISNAELDSVERQVLEKLKSDLASVTLKLGVQREISAATLALDAHKHHTLPALKAVTAPPSEPGGRAQPGRSFQS